MRSMAVFSGSGRAAAALVIAVSAALLLASTGSWASVGERGSPSATLRPAPPRDEAEGEPVTDATMPPPGQGLPTVGVPHDVPYLEDLLPAAIESGPLMAASVGPETLATGLDLDQDALADVFALVALLGLDLATLEIAAATDPLLLLDGDASDAFVLFAGRVEGLSAETIELAAGALLLAQDPGVSLKTARLGGRDVWHLEWAEDDTADSWFYVVEDVLLGVQATERARAKELIVLLPPGPTLP